MLQSKFYFSLILIFTLLVACAEERDTITVSQTSLVLDGSGNSSVISFTSSAGSWSALSSDEWCSVSPAEGNTQSGAIIISTDVNMTFAERETVVTVLAPNSDDVQIAVKQNIPDSLDLLVLSESDVLLTPDVSTTSVTLHSSTNSWEATNIASWITLSPTSGEAGDYDLSLSLTENTGGLRIAYISLAGNSSNAVVLKVTQKAANYPSYADPIAADQTGMESNAITLALKMNLGWNLGNSLEVPSGETDWGNPKTTKNLIDGIKAAGFNAVRIPCAWNSYVEDDLTCKLKDSWLARVKEVVDYCIDNEMYVVLNSHWDGGWLEENCTTDKKVENNTKQKALWEQIAMYFRDYDEHLLFAGTNEPNVETATEMAVLLSYEQTFIDAVRSTGGKNTYRVLIFQGPSTDIEKTVSLMKTLPTDAVSDRLMAEVHYYTPWNFCGMTSDASWGSMFYYWGTNYNSTTDTDRNATWGDEAALYSYFLSMKTKFTSKGIPVILGEYGAIRRTTLTGDDLSLHLASRAFYLESVTKAALENGMIPFIWDEGSNGNNGFGLFNRDNNTVFDQLALEALKKGAGITN